ncbi:MAG: MBL fold metallo-hydrolase [Planctomycetes bacterium]|nr:MBL fold metallo-hydrolase [Planctomycetota bacterium]
MHLVTPHRAALAAFAGLLGLGIGFAPATGTVASPPPRQEVAVETLAVAGGVHVLVGRGGNVGVFVGDEGVLVIDDQMKPTEQALFDAIDALSKAPWRFVLNTHVHGDHTGNNASFGARAPIVAHANVRARLADPKRDGGPLAAPALPVVTFEEGLELHLNGERVRVKHFANAHTDGDSVVFFERANVVHTGDLFFHGRFPIIDLDRGGSVRGVVEAVDELLTMLSDDVRLIPGHGALARKSDLVAYRDMLADSLKLVEAAQREGKSLEQMQQERVLSKYAALAQQPNSEQRFLETVARELGAK